MRVRRSAIVTGVIVFCTSILFACSPKEHALWIEVNEKGAHKATIAMTETVARLLLQADESKVHFTKKGKNDLVTRKMLESVLDGREESIEVRDDDGTVAKLYMADLKVPVRKSEGGKLVVETFKSGSRTLRVALPEIEIEASDDDDGTFIETSIGWKGLLPFLAREGGAIYLNSEKDDTVVWLYVE